MIGRRSFISGLVAVVSAPLFIPKERLNFGIPKQKFIVPETEILVSGPLEPILASRDLIAYYRDRPDEFINDNSWGWQGNDRKWIDLGFAEGGLQLTNEVSRFDIRVDQGIDLSSPRYYTSTYLEDRNNIRRKPKYVLNPRKRGVR